ncbi:MAG: Na+/H+ antiporter NhaC family protein [Pirellulaceae bacterium]
MAIITRRVLISLLTGVVAGALIVTHGNPVTAIATTLPQYLGSSLANGDHLRVFAFTLMMGAMVGVMARSRGMEGIVEWIAPLARSRRGGQITVWLLGLIVFFDDYANSLLLGTTMRPLADRLQISREKLAYVVDSTAAPVSGLAIISTWIAGEIGYIHAGYDKIGMGDTVDGFAVFIETIPYRFYVLWTLLFVPMVGFLGRDFGAMLRAERRMLDIPPPEPPLPVDSAPHAKLRNGRWQNAVVPIGVTVIVTLLLIVVTGVKAVSTDEGAGADWLQIFGSGDSYLSLVCGSLSGLGLAILMPIAQRILTIDEVRSAAFAGARSVSTALAILWLAWALSDVTSNDLQAGEFLGGLLQGAVHAAWMPTVVFVLASLVAFATGTSWGTMGVLMPLVIEATYQLLSHGQQDVSPHHPVLIASVGSVLAGAIFGDHCSPISDTTVLSSQASGCDHIAHVATQMPYAMVVAGVSIACGTLPVGYGVPVWWLMPLGIVVLFVYLMVFGRKR